MTNDFASLVDRLSDITDLLRDGEVVVRAVTHNEAGRIEQIVESHPPFNATALAAEGEELCGYLTRLGLRGDKAVRAVRAQVAYALAAAPHVGPEVRKRLADVVEAAEADWSRSGVSVR